MGKILIIKGADFSAVAVDKDTPVLTPVTLRWVVTDWSDNISRLSDKNIQGSTESNGVFGANAGWGLEKINNAIQGKKLAAIRCQPYLAGKLNFYICDTPNPATPLGTPVASIQIQSSQIGQLTQFTFDTPISIPIGKYLVWGESGLPDGGDIQWKYFNEPSETYLYFKCGTTTTSKNKLTYVMMDVAIVDE